METRSYAISGAARAGTLMTLAFWYRLETALSQLFQILIARPANLQRGRLYAAIQNHIRHCSVVACYLGPLVLDGVRGKNQSTLVGTCLQAVVKYYAVITGPHSSLGPGRARSGIAIG